MINDQLLDYIRQQLSLKISREVITINLKGVGWTDQDVAEAFAVIVPVAASTTPVSIEPAPFVAFVETPSIIKPQTEYSNIGHDTIDQSTIIQPASSFQSVYKSKKIFFVILVLFLLIALGGGAYAYFSGIFVSLPRLTSQAIDSARASKSGSYDITVSADLSEIDTAGEMSQFFLGNISSKQFNLTSKGSYDNLDSENFKGSSIISITDPFSLEAEFRVLDKTFYAVLTKAPTLAFLPMLTLSENKWVSFPFKSENGEVVNNPLMSMSPVDVDILNQLTVDQKEHIYQMSRDAHFVKTVKRLSPETVGGELSYHFIFNLDKKGIVAYTKSLKEYINTIGKDNSALSAFDPTVTVEDLDSQKDFEGEIWIGKNDKLLHKFIINFGFLPDKTKTEQIKMNVVGIFSGWNQPVSIVAPVESMPFETFMSEITGQTEERSKEELIKSTLSMLRTQAELFYDLKMSYSGFCSSKNVTNANKTIVENNGGIKIICKDSTKAWAAQAKLSQYSKYWCADSTGFSEATMDVLKSTKCPIVVIQL